MTANLHRSRVFKIFLAALCLLSLLPALAADAGQVTIAAAADLTFVFKDVGARFKKETGNTIRISYGSSGNFFSQIQNGAPFDMFFSADVNLPKKLEEAGLTEP